MPLQIGMPLSFSRTLKLQNSQTLKPSNSQTLKTSNSSTLQLSNSQTLKLSNSQTLKLTNSQTHKFEIHKTAHRRMQRHVDHSFFRGDSKMKHYGHTTHQFTQAEHFKPRLSWTRAPCLAITSTITSSLIDQAPRQLSCGQIAWRRASSS